MAPSRTVLELGSQDLDMEFLVAYRERLLKAAKDVFPVESELVMFSAGGMPHQFEGLGRMAEKLGSLPTDISYFYYTITMGKGTRASLYLDPDRPAKLVLEGEANLVNVLGATLKDAFPPPGGRSFLHGRLGPFMIWAMVLSIAGIFLGIVILATNEVRPLLVSWVIFISGMLGVYLSVARSKAIAQASTMSLKKRRNPYFEIVLHFITIILGIVSVILVAMLL